jgi:hypothetical protein
MLFAENGFDTCPHPTNPIAGSLLLTADEDPFLTTQLEQKSGAEGHLVVTPEAVSTTLYDGPLTSR